MVLVLHPSWKSYDDYFAALDSKYRKEVKGQLKRFQRDRLYDGSVAGPLAAFGAAPRIIPRGSRKCIGAPTCPNPRPLIFFLQRAWDDILGMLIHHKLSATCDNNVRPVRMT